MATSKKTFGFLAGPLALMLVMTIPAKDVFALNLLTVKAPIHYECQTTLSGGLWQDEKLGSGCQARSFQIVKSIQWFLSDLKLLKGKGRKTACKKRKGRADTKQKTETFALLSSTPCERLGNLWKGLGTA